MAILKALPTSGFYVEIPGISDLRVLSVDGLNDETEITETKVSIKGGLQLVEKTQGQNVMKSGQLTVKVLFKDSTPFITWREEIKTNKVDSNKKDITIYSYGTDDAPAVKFDVTECWPSKLAYPSFDSKSSDAAVATVTLEFTNFTTSIL